MRSFVLRLLKVATVMAYVAAALGAFLTVLRAISSSLLDPAGLLGFALGAVGIWLLLGWGLSELRGWLEHRWTSESELKDPR